MRFCHITISCQQPITALPSPIKADFVRFFVVVVLATGHNVTRFLSPARGDLTPRPPPEGLFCYAATRRGIIDQ